MFYLPRPCKYNTIHVGDKMSLTKFKNDVENFCQQFQDCEEDWKSDSCRFHPNLFFRNFENFNLDSDVAHYTGLIKNPGKFIS